MKTQHNKNNTTQKQSGNGESKKITGMAALRTGATAQAQSGPCRKHFDNSGGQPTISPPANVKTLNFSKYQILASGIDTLNLAIDVSWSDEGLFEYLAEKKEKARRENIEVSGTLYQKDSSDDWKFQVYPAGSKGYEWLLIGREFTFKVGNWIKPMSKPSIMAEIRSETLWCLGVEASIKRVLNLFENTGGRIINVKPSRIDLCVDMLFPAEKWNLNLSEFKVTRAAGHNLYFKHNKLEGFTIGKGKISARLYDKITEINQKSKKFWMFDIWGLDASSQNNEKVIRVELQLRREAIKELCNGSIWHLLENIDGLWAYCTQNWLKFQDNPEKHHTQRTTLEWWKAVQNGYKGAQKAAPLVRSTAFHRHQTAYSAGIRAFNLHVCCKSRRTQPEKL